MEMVRIVSRLLAKMGDACFRASKELYQSPVERRAAKWFQDQGDKTLRLDYDLNEDSLVFDLGGYEGQWASDIFARYCCWIHVFEPVQEFASRIEQRFSKNKNIIVHRFGLASETRVASIALKGDSSSIFASTKESEEIRLVKALDFISGRSITAIDVMKINTEGGEYDLLDHLIDSGFAPNIANIQVQFHDCVADAEASVVSTK